VFRIRAIHDTPVDKKDGKQSSLVELINKGKFEGLRLGETNANIAMSNNVIDKATLAIRQPGGTMIISRNKIFIRGIKSGKDTSNLGRWTWMIFKGMQGLTLRVVAAYRPCVNKRDAASVYLQQYISYNPKTTTYVQEKHFGET
jgi:hypothetical protein